MVFALCPAFQAEVTTVACNDGTGLCGTIGTESSAQCDNPPLLYHNDSHEYGTYTLTAQYRVNTYTVTYLVGTCDETSRTVPVWDSVEFNTTYSPVRGTVGAEAQFNPVPNVAVPSDSSFDGWSATWVYADGIRAFGGVYQPGDSIYWSKPASLELTGICTQNACTNAQENYYISGTECLPCPTNYPYSSGGNIGITSCYTTIKTECIEENAELPEHCIEPVERASECECNPADGTYRVYSNTTGDGDGQTEGEASLSCTKGILSATGESGYANYDLSTNSCPLIGYKLEYNCGKNPDTNQDIGGTAPAAQTGLHVDDTNVQIKNVNTGSCESGALEFSQWSCVKKEHKAPYSQVGEAENHTAGDSISPWPAYDMLCTAVWGKCTDGQYFNGTSCTSCPTGYTHSDPGATRADQCYNTGVNSCNSTDVGNTDHCINKEFVQCCTGYILTNYREYYSESGTTPVYKNENGTTEISKPNDITCTNLINTNETEAEDGYYVTENGCFEKKHVKYYCNDGYTDEKYDDYAEPDNYYTWAAASVVDRCDEKTSQYKFFKQWKCVSGDYEMYKNAKQSDKYEWDTDMKCYADWGDREFNITYNVVLVGKNDQGSPDYKIYDSTDSDVVKLSPGAVNLNANPTKYTANSNFSLETGANNALKDTSNNKYNIIGGWYECKPDGSPTNTTYISTIKNDVGNNLRDLNLCIQAGWTITYKACYDSYWLSLSGANQGSVLECTTTGELTDSVCDLYNKTYNNTNHKVTLPTVTDGACLKKIELSSDTAFTGSWFRYKGSNETHDVETAGFRSGNKDYSGGNLIVYTKINKKYTVTYDCDDDNPGNDPKDRTGYDENTSVPTPGEDSCNFSDGSVIDKWNCDNGIGYVIPRESFKIKGNTTCTAVPILKKYDLTYVCNNDNAGGTAPVDSDSPYVAGVDISIVPDSNYGSCNSPSGKHFTGWSCSNGLMGGQDGQMPAQPVECSGQWDGNDYTVTYVCDDGDEHVDFKDNLNWIGDQEGADKVKYQDTPYESFRNVGQTCKPQETRSVTGWSCSERGTPWYSILNKKWDIDSDVTCNAVWVDKKYKVEYECNNGGKGDDWTDQGTDNQGYAYGATVNVGSGRGSCDVPNNAKEFDYWSCQTVPSNNVTEYYDEDRTKIKFFSMPGQDVTCTAVWKDREYTVTYDCNGGKIKNSEGNETENTTETQSVIYGNNYKFESQSQKCSNPDNISIGWNCHRNDAPWYSEKIWEISGNVTCTAQWMVKRYPLTYDCANGNYKVLDSNSPYAVGSKATLQSYAGCGTKTGSSPTGWKCLKNNGNDADVDDSGKIIMNSDVKCTLGWQETINNIKYWGCINGWCDYNLSLDDCVRSAYAPEDKLTYSRTKVVTFPLSGDSAFRNCVRDMGYQFNGRWFDSNNYGIQNTSIRGDNPLNVYTNIIPYRKLWYNCGWAGSTNLPENGELYLLNADVTVAQVEKYCDEEDGYTFTGWKCNGTSRKAGDEFKIAEDTVCIAQWGTNIYRITYDCTSQSPKTQNTQMKYDVQFGGSHTVKEGNDLCSHNGYTFDGWDCKKVNKNTLFGTYKCSTTMQQEVGGNCKEDNSITWDFADNLKCDALWKVNHYNVYYNKGNCIDDTSYDNIYEDVYSEETQNGGATYGLAYGIHPTAANNVSAKTGYEFKGWSKKEQRTDSDFDENGNLVNAWNGESKWTYEDDLTVYAVCAPAKFNVIYDKNNCESNTGENYVHVNGATYGQRYNALTGTATGIYAGTGYEFKDWSATNTLTDEDFNEDGTLKNPWTGVDQWSDTEALTVYAVCTPRPYAVKYHNQTCGDTPDNTTNVYTDTVKYGNEYTLKTLPIRWETGNTNRVNHEIYEPEGYEFIGWADAIVSNEPKYEDLYKFSSWNRDGALDLWAMCKQTDYHVTYDCNTINNPYDSYNNCDENDPTGCVTPEDDKVYHINQVVTLKENTCKKTGYHFDGWVCVTDDSAEDELPITNKLFTMKAADAKCTAQWIEDEYHVSYDCDTDKNECASCETDNDSEDCSCTPQDDAAYHYNANVTTKDNTCKKTGHYGTQWLCDGTEVTPEDSFGKITHDITCVMQWEPNKYDVTYKSGTCGGASKEFLNSVTYGNTFEIKDITDVDINGYLSVQNGYEFLGWTKSQVNAEDMERDGFVVDYVAGATSDIVTDDVTLYAVCKKKVYNICYDFQVDGGQWGHSTTDPLYTFTVDTEAEDTVIEAVHRAALVDNVRIPPFYVFDGWYNNKEGSGEQIQKVLSDGVLLEEPLTVQCSNRIAAQQCNNGETSAKCDMMLYAHWNPAGKVSFNCFGEYTVEHQKAVDETVTAEEYDDICDSDEIGECEIKAWHCENDKYDDYPKNFEENDYIDILVPDTTIKCTPVIDCSGVKRSITYEVYDAETEESIETVVVNDENVNVAELKPSTYTTAEAEYYPEISVSDCKFYGWFEDRNFTKPTEHTPVAGKDIAIDEEPGDITVYGKMLCGFHCNEPGHAHWLHIGDAEEDKVCLYEEKPHDKRLPFVRVKGKKYNKPYYMILSENPEMVIHENSDKKMRIQYKGRTYNVCDKSSCPD